MEEEELEERKDYSSREVIANLPDDLGHYLKAYIADCGLDDLSDMDDFMNGAGQIQQLVMLSEYSILQFGVLLTVLKEQELTLADDAKDALSLVAELLSLLSGHMELLLAPKNRH